MLRRVLTTALAAVAVAGLTTAPAYADPNPPYTPTTIYVNGYTVGVFVNGLQISATCEADVTGVVAATVIEECRIYTEGVPGPNHPAAAPGNVAVSTFTQRVTSLDFVLCFSAYTIPLHDPTQLVRYSDCAWDYDSLTGVGSGGGSATL
jgi:hypothetical protein